MVIVKRFEFLKALYKFSIIIVIIYLSLRCHHQNDSCIKMGSDKSHLMFH